jgi:AcrR family transcriptional regulator
MTRAVFEKGYTAATVADAVRHARVSRGTFYVLFPSKEACFLDAYAHGVDVLVDRVAGAVEAAPDWRAGLQAGLAAYLDTLVDEPMFARSYMLEVHAAGAAAQRARDAALERFATRYGQSFAAAAREDPRLGVPSPATLFVLAAGVDQLVSAHVRAHGPDGLRDLLPTLLTAALTVLNGAKWT